ncbi:MAG: hypothetical protein HZA54_03965, partial [Planctomycetes bacterium]|nr:hypothetical protein [Planctomycetota bacterium]
EIPADRTRLKQILYNLLSNAIKYNRQGGRVEVRASVQGERLMIAVEDTGSGIREEELPRLFQEFERLDSGPGPRPEGTGLGLVLTRRLVELHGGTVAVASVWGQGTTFTVALPLAASAGSPAPPAP